VGCAAAVAAAAEARFPNWLHAITDTPFPSMKRASQQLNSWLLTWIRVLRAPPCVGDGCKEIIAFQVANRPSTSERVRALRSPCVYGSSQYADPNSTWAALTRNVEGPMRVDAGCWGSLYAPQVMGAL
jgi:hypothetical protein